MCESWGKFTYFRVSRACQLVGRPRTQNIAKGHLLTEFFASPKVHVIDLFASPYAPKYFPVLRLRITALSSPIFSI